MSQEMWPAQWSRCCSCLYKDTNPIAFLVSTLGDPSPQFVGVLGQLGRGLSGGVVHSKRGQTKELSCL